MTNGNVEQAYSAQSIASKAGAFQHGSACYNLATILACQVAYEVCGRGACTIRRHHSVM